MKIDGMSTGYVQLIQHLLDHGKPVAPRGIPTVEVIGFEFTLENPYDNLPIRCGRGLNSKIAYVEALQLVSGRSFPELLVKIAPNFQQFTNGGLWFHGAYGPRVRPQIIKNASALIRDPDSRQAIAVIWDALYDGDGEVNDTPCTISLQWFIRDGKLEAVTHMRSNDVWWGTPYDVYQFTFLQQCLAQCLGIQAGPYHHLVGSFHMYDRDRERAREVRSSYEREPTRVIHEGDGWHGMREAAECILANTVPPTGETVHAEVLRGILHGG